jgi:hypothetical protein
MSPLFLALSLFLQPAQTAAQAPTPGAPAAEEAPRLPAGAPAEDYPFVSWCYGALRGYLDLHDEVMPEVTRIEAEFRKPGVTLAEDLKVYADQQKDARKDVARYQRAMTAAEKASMRPINQVGAEAVRKGRSIWNAGPEVTKAQKAQLWMSWSPPARCDVIAKSLEERSMLAGAALRANAEPEAAVPAAPPQ